jgi:hypothetical protein
MIRDFKFAVRLLFQTPALNISAVVVLSLGIGECWACSCVKSRLRCSAKSVPELCYPSLPRRSSANWFTRSAGSIRSHLRQRQFYLHWQPWLRRGFPPQRATRVSPLETGFARQYFADQIV